MGRVALEKGRGVAERWGVWLWRKVGVWQKVGRVALEKGRGVAAGVPLDRRT